MNPRFSRAIGWVTVLAAVAVSPVLTAPVASAAGCTPRVSLDEPVYDEATQIASFDAHYKTCGKAMVLSLKSRIYHEGRYEWSVRSGVQGRGIATVGTGGCGGESIKGQYLVTLKIGPTLYAKSDPVTYTLPAPPCG